MQKCLNISTGNLNVFMQNLTLIVFMETKENFIVKRTSEEDDW